MLPGSKAYLFCIAIGILSALLYFYFASKTLIDSKQKKIKFLASLLFSSLCFYLSALFFDMLFHGNKESGYQLRGITFLGGLLGGISAFIFFYFLFKIDDKKKLIFHLNILAPGICIAHFFGRIGCFLNGCCFGKPSSSFLAVVFPVDTPAYEIYQYYTPLWPVQLFEALGLLLIFIFLINIKNRRFSYYLISYSILRFFLEFLRGDDRGQFFNLMSPAQEISIILLIIGSFLHFYLLKISELKTQNSIKKTMD